MRKPLKPIIAFMLLSALHHAKAQQQESDDAFKEFAKLGQLYKKSPLRLTIHISNAANPVTTAMDTMRTTMDVYMSNHVFYMQSEGLEEIINDSLVVMVNNKIKEMQLFQSSPAIMSRFSNAINPLVPDSSLAVLKNKYTASVTETGKNTRTIDVQSKAMITGTRFPKEAFSISYNASNYEVMEYSQRHTRLIPIDSSVYTALLAAGGFTQRLLHSSGTKGDMYFLAKENTSTYRLIKTGANNMAAPVNTADRIIKLGEEQYLPAKGFEAYSLTRQF